MKGQAIGPDDLVVTARCRMQVSRRRHALVTSRGTVVGMISVRKLSETRRSRVADVMSKRQGPQILRFRLSRPHALRRH
jgi:hypothetical protein